MSGLGAVLLRIAGFISRIATGDEQQLEAMARFIAARLSRRFRPDARNVTGTPQT